MANQNFHSNRIGGGRGNVHCSSSAHWKALRQLLVIRVMKGVKQGGVLSPILFCVYIDDLLKSL